MEEVPLTSGGRYVGGAVVLAAKVLTESDAKGRIILPRAMVEHNLGWFVGTYRCDPRTTAADTSGIVQPHPASLGVFHIVTGAGGQLLVLRANTSRRSRLNIANA